MEAGEQGRALRSQLLALDERYRSLTEREREVMRGVVRGMPNRALAEALGVCERTVEVHRARVMKKMGAESLPDLVRKHALYSQHRGQDSRGQKKAARRLPAE
jgi:FixJ family two-component response regulator